MALGFPGLADINRRTIKGPVNPLDKSTVVSIFPFSIDENKYTTNPSRYQIPAASYENPQILVVGPCSWWRELDAEQPLLEITNSSIQVADSIVRDFCNGILECDMETQMPGLFYVIGALTLDQIRKDHKTQLDKANEKQNNWFRALIQKANSDWARTNGNPLAISKLAKHAASSLGQDYEWMKDHRAAELVRCFACGALRNPNYPICQACKTIDPNHPKAKELKFAV